MYNIEPDLTAEYILKYVSQHSIFEHFLHINVEVGEMFCSPLRRDKSPTCNLAWSGGKLWFRDWAEPKPKDCFNIVQEVRNVSFMEALKLIKRELIDNIENLKPRIKHKEELQPRKSHKSKIQVKFGTWKPELIDYLKSHGISSEQCKKFNVFPPSHVWLNGKLIYTYKKSDPALAYYFGKAKNGDERWKIYFFTRRGKYRFLTNTNRINGWIQIPETGDNLIITKSLKDVMCLDVLGYSAIAMQNETTEPYSSIIKKLKARFGIIWSFYDFDEPGIRLANILKHKHSIPYLFLTNGKYNTRDYGAKDISDYIKTNSIQEAKELLLQYIPPF
jgi:hypothetical protein